MRERKRAWPQKVESRRATLKKERGADSRSLPAAMVFPLLWVSSEFATFLVDIGAENVRRGHYEKSTRGAEASVMRHIPGLIT